MIRIINVTQGRPHQGRVSVRTNWGAGTAAFPILIDLGPNEKLDVPAQSVNDWDPGVKQWLAEYVSNDYLKVYTINSLHDYQDKDHNAAYGLDYLIDAKFDPLALTHAIAMATSLNTEMQLHFDALTVHAAPVAGSITASVPTNLATLQTWIGDAQTEFATHIADATTHTVADTWNSYTPTAAVDLATSITALRELHRAYHSHKEWLDPTSEAEMNISTLLAY